MTFRSASSRAAFARFGNQPPPEPIQWLSDNEADYNEHAPHSALGYRRTWVAVARPPFTGPVGAVTQATAGGGPSGLALARLSGSTRGVSRNAEPGALVTPAAGGRGSADGTRP